MAMFGQSSFRRILLSRILLLSIPILLIGVAVTFRKARTSLLETARQNLTESAIRKAEDIQASIRALETNLVSTSQTTTLESGTPEDSQAFLADLMEKLPTDVSCLQLTDPETGALIASTCGNTNIGSGRNSWPQQQPRNNSYPFLLETLPDSPVENAAAASPSRRPINRPEDTPEDNPDSTDNLSSHLDLVVTTPVYGADDNLRYTLTAQTTIYQMESGQPGSLLGYTVVIDQSGDFLAHPISGKIGNNIADAGDASRLRNIMDNALLRDDRDVRHLFSFSGDDTEWLAGYSPIEISISAGRSQMWVVLAVTRLDHALHGLEDIRRILVISTTGLLGAHLLAMLYMARDLALPIEQLGKYARRIHTRDPLERAPRNFRIRELNHLSEVLDNMVRRLEERAKELESAWQEAEAANQLKSEFLANTSHELRTPLNAIIGCIRLVRDGCCDSEEEETEFLDRADEAAIHLLEIINDLLDIAKIEAGTLSLSLESVDMRQLLQEVIDLQTMQIHQKGLRLSTPDLPEPVIVRADSAKLKQVLLNVVYNAIKFTDHGSIAIGARIEPAIAPEALPSAAETNGHQTNEEKPPAPNESLLLITVKDTGIGIDPTQQHKLFRPFVMVDGTTTRKFEGTGLGLAISRNLTELMGGSITLHSAGLGQGTTVEIAMPVFSTGLQPTVASPDGLDPAAAKSHSSIR